MRLDRRQGDALRHERPGFRNDADPCPTPPGKGTRDAMISVPFQDLLVSGDCVPLAAQTVDFTKQVQPLLAQKCYACHGEEVQQSGLRLDKRQNAMRGGDYGRENSNKWMRRRVFTQAIAIGLITIGFIYKATHH